MGEKSIKIEFLTLTALPSNELSARQIFKRLSIAFLKKPRQFIQKIEYLRNIGRCL